MKKLIPTIAAIAVALGSPALAKDFAPIRRIPYIGPDGKPGWILTGAIVPPGYETFYLSGLIADPIDPAKTQTWADYGDTKTQTLNILSKIKAILEANGYKMSDVVKVQAFLAADPSLGKLDFSGMKEGFSRYFQTGDNPNSIARTTVQVANLVAPQFLVEIEVTAARPAR